MTGVSHELLPATGDRDEAVSVPSIGGVKCHSDSTICLIQPFRYYPR